MLNVFLRLVQTDLIQAKMIRDKENFSLFRFLYLFLRSKTCRIHTFIRLRSSNAFMAYIAKRYLDKYFIEIGRNTKIGKYFFMPHPRCIIIANNVVLGEHVHVNQYVTIGGNFKKTKLLNDGSIQKLPVLGDRVMVHPSAVIGGPVTIGSDVVIGANSSITKDIPSNSIAFAQNKLANKKITIPKQGGEFIIKEEN